MEASSPATPGAAESATGAAVAAEPTSAAPAAAPPVPLRLARGAKIQLGRRQGVVEAVRGDWKKPYDVRVRWDGEKYPQYIIFRTLEIDNDSGRLKVL
ncbi:MAG TPA: hypothetical protein VFD71_03735 [Planctomycetota bacterium]|nr:hypothetical protein [Planctomycetota bacterium]